jgi:transcription initiation factor TFIIB
MSRHVQQCPDCGGTVTKQNSERVCEDCSMVLGGPKIARNKALAFNEFEKRKRRQTGAAETVTRHNKGLMTEIDVGVEDSRRQQRLRVQHQRTKISSTVERNRVRGNSEVKRLSAALGVPVEEQACTIFKRAQEDGVLYGRSVEAMAAAAVYAVARIHDCGRTLDDVVAVAQADKQQVKASYDGLNRECDLPVPPLSGAEVVPQIATDVGIPALIETEAKSLARRAENAGVVDGYKPQGVAAGALYVASREALTQVELAEHADVSPDTVRNAVQQIRDTE